MNCLKTSHIQHVALALLCLSKACLAHADEIEMVSVKGQVRVAGASADEIAEIAAGFHRFGLRLNVNQDMHVGEVLIWDVARPQPEPRKALPDINVHITDHCLQPRIIIAEHGQRILVDPVDTSTGKTAYLKFQVSHSGILDPGPLRVFHVQNGHSGLTPISDPKRADDAPCAAGYLFVASSQGACMTGSEGQFELTLPAGQRSLRLWHEAAGYLNVAVRDREIKVKPKRPIPIELNAPTETLDLIVNIQEFQTALNQLKKQN